PNKGAGKRLQWYGLGLVALIVLIPVTGLGPAGAFAFAGIAKAFDSTKTWADLVIGIIFTTLVWIVFAKGLGVQLGPLVRGLIS
ncbi:MAG: tripartite tricarboxylate transporter TctB family protein, partial [Betaproteobacteria bacterium]|nr:tripartite tricarboxylate transporter TctB family protein [Betaproteobacteria bacterium]